MKKTLVAIAALTAVSAFAQSSVQIYGVMDGGIQSLDIKGNHVTNSGIGSGGSATSQLHFHVVDDIGGGTQGLFHLEIDPNLADTSNKTAGTSATGTTSNSQSSLGNGEAYAGLAGAYGKVRFGTPNAETLLINGDANNGFATAVGSGYRVSSFDAVRFQNSARYDSPEFAGFSASYLVSAKNGIQTNAGTVGLNANSNNQTNGRDAVSEISARYINGPLSVRAASLNVDQYAKVSNSADNFSTTPTWQAVTAANFKLNSLSAKYAVNQGLSVAGFYQTASSDPAIVTATSTTKTYDRKTVGVSAKYAVTPVVDLMLNYQHLTTGAAETVGTKNAKTNVLGLGADYNLSKRTAVYYRFERDADGVGARSITGYTAVNGSTTYKAQAVGVRVAF